MHSSITSPTTATAVKSLGTFSHISASVGAKQNRILNTSVLVAAESTVKIPVSCVERGRWRYRSRHFGSSGYHSSSGLRYLLACSVTHSVEAETGHRSDQGKVWAEVKKQQQDLGVASETVAMSDTFTSRKNKIDEFREKLAYVEGASGLVVAVGQKVLTLDLFDRPDTCSKAWGRLLSGFALDAMRSCPSEDDRVQPAEAQRLVDLFGSVSWKQAAAVGEGEEYRALVQSGEHAFKLCLAGSVVHASVLVSA
ncbi:MAG: DUF6569 family protein [Planctomycetota bacterium]